MSDSTGTAGLIETSERKAFYERIGQKNLAPLWTSLNDLITPEPRSKCVPAHWSFEDVREAMMEAGTIITAKEAERRVLVLENPGLRGESKITTDLYAGVQLVLPGEVAPAHRHAQTALRFVLEGSGAHTSVNGERTMMDEGDFIITPPMAWHDHGNESDRPIIWLDGLDIPMVQFLDTSFAEHLDEDEQPITRPIGDSDVRYGANLLPVDHHSGGGTSPIFNYPYARTREALERMRRTNAWDPCHGLKMRYVNPSNGKYAMATMGTFMQLLPRGFSTASYRSTDATVFVPIEGRGRSRIGKNVVVEWCKRDIFVVPSWHQVSHEADEDSVLFSFSDRPVQEALYLFREDRGPA
ncbi:gentisate 1,2-dioxygenase [Caballeronia sp. S22]